MPAIQEGTWRIGHFKRNVPEGYIESVLNDNNQLADKRLARYYDKLRLITRGDIFSNKRLKAIWDMNTGKYESLIDKRFYSKPGDAPDSGPKGTSLDHKAGSSAEERGGAPVFSQ